MIKRIETYAREKLTTEVTAHDFEHTLRVYKIAQVLAKKIECDIEVVKVAALTHDIIDKKVSIDVETSKRELYKTLQSIGYSADFITHVFHIIENISFSSGRIPNTIEGKIVQDADRIDAIGAIAIARTFSYGGSKNRRIYDKLDETSSIHHFYEKLLLLKDMLNTEEAKRIAESRHDFMLKYLEEFHKEWNLEDIGE